MRGKPELCLRLYEGKARGEARAFPSRLHTHRESVGCRLNAFLLASHSLARVENQYDHSADQLFLRLPAASHSFFRRSFFLFVQADREMGGLGETLQGQHEANVRSFF